MESDKKPENKPIPPARTPQEMAERALVVEGAIATLFKAMDISLEDGFNGTVYFCAKMLHKEPAMYESFLSMLAANIARINGIKPSQPQRVEIVKPRLITDLH